VIPLSIDGIYGEISSFHARLALKYYPEKVRGISAGEGQMSDKIECEEGKADNGWSLLIS